MIVLRTLFYDQMHYRTHTNTDIKIINLNYRSTRAATFANIINAGKLFIHIRERNDHSRRRSFNGESIKKNKN